MNEYVLSADIGQMNDYTALSALHAHTPTTFEQIDPAFALHNVPPSEREARRAAHLDLVHLERFRHLPYPEQVDRITERWRELLEHAGRAPCSLVIDATGVGKPVLDMLRERGLKPRGIIITGAESVSSSDGMTRVPKRELMTRLQVAMQTKRLRAGRDIPFFDELVKEIRGFRVKITLTGHARFGNDLGSWREADHDDLVLSVALAVWTVEHRDRADLATLRRASGVA